MFVISDGLVASNIKFVDRNLHRLQGKVKIKDFGTVCSNYYKEITTSLSFGKMRLNYLYSISILLVTKKR